jgi:hypothetical protein
VRDDAREREKGRQIQLERVSERDRVMGERERERYDG